MFRLTATIPRIASRQRRGEIYIGVAVVKMSADRAFVQAGRMGGKFDALLRRCLYVLSQFIVDNAHI
jgi:hypothetical protein